MVAVRSVRIESLDVPFAAPMETGRERWRARRLGLVRVAADGIEGLGEIALGASGDPSAADLPGGLADGLVGLDPCDADAVSARLDALTAGLGEDRGLRAGLETALLDVAGQALGLPVRNLLAAGGRSSVAVNGLIWATEPDEAAHQARGLVGQGIGCLKLKVGFEPDTERLVARVARVRDAIGGRARLRLDANGAWPPEVAVARLRAVAAFDLEYVEQPISDALGPPALARLRHAVGVPIAADEAVGDLATARALLRADAVDALVVKPARVGGPRAARRIVELADGAGVPVIVSTLFETGVGLATALHVAATIPGTERAHGLATAELLVSDLLIDGPRPVAGRLAVPEQPGLGVRLDPAAIGRYRTAGPASGPIRRASA